MRLCWIVTLWCDDGRRETLVFKSHPAAINFLESFPKAVAKIQPATMRDPSELEVELDP
jgi:hypothetical protein